MLTHRKEKGEGEEEEEEEEDGKQGQRGKQEQKVKTCQDVWVRGTRTEQKPDAKTETTEV